MDSISKKIDIKNDWGYHRLFGTQQPQKNNIIVFNSPENEQILLVKRIAMIFHKNDTIIIDADNYKLAKSMVSQEGHRLTMIDSIVYINNIPKPCYVFEQNHYFLLGDNESNSRDSRFWGCIPEEAIVGKINRVLFSRQDSIYRMDRVFHKIQ